MSGPRRAQTMVNKEEKMNIKQNKMNLKINEPTCEAKNEQREKKQMIENEMYEDNHQQPLPNAHLIPMALQQDSAHGKALEETRGQTGIEVRRGLQRAPRTTRERPRPTMPRYRLSGSTRACVSTLRLPKPPKWVRN